MKIIENNFKSSLTFPTEEVQTILELKIKEENDYVENNSKKEAINIENNLFSKINYVSNNINVVSLFSGAGGLDLGVKLANAVTLEGQIIAYKSFHDKKKFFNHSKGLNIIYSNDILQSANETYKLNFPDLTVKDSRDIRNVISFPKCNLILGGFPCPGFSSAGPRLLDDPRNFLYIHYLRALTQAQPAFFIAENVKGLMTMANGQVLSQIKEDFAATGYQVSTHLVNSRDYGVPQIRERVFIIGTRNDIVENYDFNYELPKVTHGHEKMPFITLKEAIGNLPLNPDDVFESDYSSMYMSRNRKKTWSEQSFTIQASGRQAPQHPEGNPMIKLSKDLWEFSGEFNRRLSVREVARIQTFPDWFSFSDGSKPNVSKNHKLNEKYKQIGNAVPVLLAEKISRPIIEFLNNHPELLI